MPPTDRWSKRLARLDPAVDRLGAEPVRIVPMRSGDFTGQIDASRPIVELDAYLVIERGEQQSGGEGRHIWNTKQSAGKIELHITKALIPPGTVFAKNDVVRALARSEKFIVERADTKHEGRVVLVLSEGKGS